jgi:hypothetical protein
MNPQSIESEDTPNQLAFRASLGGELYTGSLSIHPKVTGSWVITSSFTSGNNSWTSSLTPLFTYNIEYNYYDQPAVGIQNPITDKIKIVNSILPSGDTLSPYISIQQNPAISQSVTKDIDYVEVAFSPQNEINIDIYDQLGYFNIGEYIGDPRQVPTQNTSYPDLDRLRDAYFEKYTSNYNEWDYIRLIKFFDNSLFKMIQDWVPARTSLAAGVVIKQHVLERNKYPLPQLTQSQHYYTGSISHLTIVQDGMTTPISSTDFESYPLEETSGGSGGSLESSELLVYSTSSIVLGAGSDIKINLSQSGIYNVYLPISSSGTVNDAIITLFNNNNILLSKIIYTTSSTGTLNFILDTNFELSGFLTIQNTSDNKDITLTNVNIYKLPDYYKTVETPYGTGSILVTNEYDYNGELEGTIIEVTDGNLNGDNIFLKSSTVPTNYIPTYYKTNTINDSAFLSINTSPNPGEIYLLYDTGSNITPD